jgi:hypothetical protein
MRVQERIDRAGRDPAGARVAVRVRTDVVFGHDVNLAAVHLVHVSDVTEPAAGLATPPGDRPDGRGVVVAGVVYPIDRVPPVSWVGLGAQWVTENTGASQIAAASDSANGPLLAVVGAKTVLAKEGSLSAQWVTEYTGASHVAVASDPVHGPLIGILTGTTALAKEGGLSAQWVTEYNGASQVAVAG